MMLRICTNQFTNRKIKNLKKLGVKFKRATRDTLKDTEPYIKAKAKELMTQPKHGNTYNVYISRQGRKLKRSRVHVASSKDEPFAWMSGSTFRSLRRVVPRWSHMIVGFGTPQAAWDKTDRTVLKRIFYSAGFERELDRLHTANMKRELAQ